MTFVGTAPVEPVGMGPLGSSSNYFLGDDPAQWRQHLPNYGGVAYRGLYEGSVDYSFRELDGVLKFDAFISPGFPAADIQFQVPAEATLALDAAGRLEIRTAGVTVVLHELLAYQDGAAGRVAIPALYELRGGGVFGLWLAEHDTSLPVVIDPQLTQSIVIGGSGFDRAGGIALGADGSRYIVGQTQSPDFPISGPFQAGNGNDAFVLRLDVNGTLLTSTYFGGAGADFFENVHIGPEGSLYINGMTESADFPTVNPFQASLHGCSDAVVVKVSPDLSAVQYSTYFGGSSCDWAHDLAVVGADDVIFCGHTFSPDLPTANALQPAGDGFYDAFVTRLAMGANDLVYSTYVGGTSVAPDDFYGVAAKADGSVYLAGVTHSTGFPVTTGAVRAGVGDSVLLGLTPSGALASSTLLGGAGYDYAETLVLDSAGDLYFGGQTDSADFPVLNGAQSVFGGSRQVGAYQGDGFVAKFAADGTTPLYATYLGGSGDELVWALAVDSVGRVFATGFTSSSDFPVTSDAIFATYGGGGTVPNAAEIGDAFVSVVQPASGPLLYSTYLGGAGDDYGRDLRIALNDDVVIAGATTSPAFLTTAGPQLIGPRGGADVFVATFRNLVPSPPQPADISFLPSTYTSAVGQEVCAVAQVTDQHGLGFPDLAVTFSSEGVNSAADVATTNADGFVVFCYTGTTPGVDTATASAAALSDTALVSWIVPQSCPAPLPVTTPVPSVLTYVGPATASCGGTLAASVQLTTDAGEPLPNATVAFDLGVSHVAAVTDAQGLARATLSAGTGGALVASYPGDAGHGSATYTTPIAAERKALLMSYTGATAFTEGVNATLGVVLNGVDGLGVANAQVSFTLGAASVSATTDAAGTANAAISLPPGNAATELVISTPGDACSLGATLTVSVATTSSGAGGHDAFVIWGGNNQAPAVGDSVNLWGAQWHRQVHQGDYHAHSEFKGFASLVADFSICQPEARTTSDPRLNAGCWVADPGNAQPPEVTVGQEMDVIVATSIDKGNVGTGCHCHSDSDDDDEHSHWRWGHGRTRHGRGPSRRNDSQEHPSHRASFCGHSHHGGSHGHDGHNDDGDDDDDHGCHTRGGDQGPCNKTIYGNISAVAHVIIMQAPTGGASPGQRIDAIITGFSLTGIPLGGTGGTVGAPAVSLAGVTAQQTLPGQLLPGQAAEVSFTLTNGSATDLVGVSLVEVIQQATQIEATVTVGSVPAGSVSAASVPIQADALEPRGAGESGAAYEARLGAAAGSRVTAVGTVTGTDSAGHPLVPISVSTVAPVVLPRLALSISAPLCVGPGDAMAFTVTATQLGTATARTPTVEVETPQGTLQAIFSDLAPGETQTLSLPWVVPSVAPREPLESEDAYRTRLAALDGARMAVNARLTWLDDAGNFYGAVERAYALLLRVPNPQVVVGAPSAMAPLLAAVVQWVVFNEGTGNAYALDLETQQGADAPIGHAIAVVEGTDNAVLTTTYTPSAVAPRGAGESAAQYLARLQLAAAEVPFTGTVMWQDANGGLYGPVSGSTTSRVAVPIVDAVMTTAAVALPGTVHTYNITLQNVGTAAAFNVVLATQGPGGAGPGFTVGALGVNAVRTLQFASIIPLVGLTPVVTGGVSVGWENAAGAAFGALEAQASSSVQNTSPRVDAGANVALALPSTTVMLHGSATDDGIPGAALMYQWVQLAGPAPANVQTPQLADTVVTLGAVGTYTFELRVGDGELTGSDTVRVDLGNQVNMAPVVSAGTSTTVILPTRTANLVGTVNDDGLPAGSVVRTTWIQLAGPAAVAIANPEALASSTHLPLPGLYAFRLIATDGVLDAYADVTVTLAAAGNTAPVVSAGADQSLTWPAQTATLAGVATDDGLPAGSTLSVFWSQSGGPAPVSIDNPFSLSPNVTVPGAGDYALTLYATDGAALSSDEMLLQVLGVAAGPDLGLVNLADGAVITAPTPVSVPLVSGEVASWTLEHRARGEPDWIAFASGTSIITGTLDPTLMLNGLYDVRARATNPEGGVTVTETVGVEIDGNMKVGNFTLSFVDMEIPMAGMSIQVTRTYDSRDKRVGDFGVGWTLSVTNVRLQESGVTGAVWEGTTLPGFLKTYCVRPARTKRITVTLPDNDVHEFVAKLEPECQLLVPPADGVMTYVPQPGTNSRLRPLLNDYVLLNGGFPGPFDVVDLDTLEPFDPEFYLLTLHDGRELVVDDNGKVVSISDLNNNTLSFGPTGISHSAGKDMFLERDALQRVTSASAPGGQVLHYTYDARGDLVGFSNALGEQTTFAYNDTHALLDIFDPRGVRAIRNAYDADGRLISHTDAQGNVIAYTHDLDARVEQVTDRLGNVTTHAYDVRGNVTRTVNAEGEETLYSYNAADDKLTETNALGQTTTYSYNGDHDVTSVTDPLGNTTAMTYNFRGQVLTQTDARGILTTTVYDPKGNLSYTVDGTGAVTAFSYDGYGNPTRMVDGLGNLTSYTYDRYGNQDSERDAQNHETRYTHDLNGNRLSMTTLRTTATGPETVVTRYSYDAQNRLVNTVMPDGSMSDTQYNAIGKPSVTRDALGRETATLYDDQGRMVQTTLPDGTTESTAFDAEGRRISSTDRAGHTTTYAYDRVGRLTRTTQTDGSFRSTAYDAAGRVVSETDARGNSVSYVYDTAGRRTAVQDATGAQTTSEFDGNGNVVAVTDANGGRTTFFYDNANRRTRVLAPDLTERVTTYDAVGRRVSETDQAGRVTQYGYDTLGRLASVTDALGQVTTYGYDEVGNHISQTDANNHTTAFGYDNVGRRVQRTLPLGMYETMVYNAVGNMVAKTDFNGHTTSYNYDVMNRLTSKTPDLVLAEPTVSFTYFPTGQRATMTDATGVTTYTYDDRDRLIEKATPQGTLFYTYDPAGNVTSIRSSNAGGTDVQYTWDANNRLQDVIDVHAGTFTYSYDDVGNETGLSYPNGIQKTTTYDTLNRLRTIGYVNGPTTVASYAYSLDVTGRRTGVVEHSGRTVAYGYDGVYRLTSEDVSADPNGINGRVDYTYDPVGNRLRRDSTLGPVSDQVFSYNGNDQIETVEQYDLNGNLIQDGDGNTYQWDYENHLISKNGNEVVLTYDGDWCPLLRATQDTTTATLCDGVNPSGHIQWVEQNAGVSWQPSVYGLTALWEPGAYLHSDGQGSIRSRTQGSAERTEEATWDAFGNSVAGLGDGLGYLGEHAMTDVGALYLRARWAHVVTGRFLGLDALQRRGMGDRGNEYSYAGADPVNFADRTGWYLEAIGSVDIVTTLGDLLLADFNLFQEKKPGQSPVAYFRNFSRAEIPVLRQAQYARAYSALLFVGVEDEAATYEYGGLICYRPASHTFYPTGPVKGHKGSPGGDPAKVDVDQEAAACIWPGDVPTADYHTHPAGREGYSEIMHYDDYRGNYVAGRDGYVRTALGALWIAPVNLHEPGELGSTLMSGANQNWNNYGIQFNTLGTDGR